MPETVEVSIITDFINNKFKNSTLKNVIVKSGRYSRHKLPDGFSKFINSLPAKIEKIDKKGKFIYITLDKDRSIWITLGLSGELLLKPGKHSHITFETNKGNFYFDDIRNFGTVKFVFTKDELEKKLRTLGPDPLIENISKKDFITIMGKKHIQKKDIADVLMDQKIISGIGNYLRAEILYDARISPFKKVQDMTDKDLENLLKSINKVVMASYKKQDEDGIHTYPFKIYRKKETKSGEKIVCKEQKGRTIWYVPSVQK